MKQIKCPNCGANLPDKSLCSYCGSMFYSEDNTYAERNKQNYQAALNNQPIINNQPVINNKPYVSPQGNAPHYNEIFTEQKPQQKYCAKGKNYGLAAFIFALLGLFSSTYVGPSPLFSIISLILVKKCTEKSGLKKAAKIIAIIGLFLWFTSNVLHLD